MKRLARVARGRRPQYFADPATDKLMSVVLSLATELSVVRDRLDSVERLLSAAGVVAPGAVDGFIPDEAADQERRAARADYLERILRAVQTDLGESGQAPAPSDEEIFRLLDPKENS